MTVRIQTDLTDGMFSYRLVGNQVKNSIEIPDALFEEWKALDKLILERQAVLMYLDTKIYYRDDPEELRNIEEGKYSHWALPLNEVKKRLGEDQ